MSFENKNLFVVSIYIKEAKFWDCHIPGTINVHCLESGFLYASGKLKFARAYAKQLAQKYFASATQEDYNWPQIFSSNKDKNKWFHVTRFFASSEDDPCAYFEIRIQAVKRSALFDPKRDIFPKRLDRNSP